MKIKPHTEESGFRVPDGYFDSFPGRLQEKIALEEGRKSPVLRLSQRSGFRLAIAAAFVGLALLSIPIINNIGTRDDPSTDLISDISLLESAVFFSNELEIASYLDGGDAVLDDDEAYVNQAMDYLAMNDIDLDLLMEE